MIFAAMASFMIAACGTPRRDGSEMLIVAVCLDGVLQLCLFPYALGLPLQLLPTFMIR